jgi:uncharacterized protein DUF3891
VLVRVEAEGALAIGQLSHAWLSGQLARAWGNERFDAPEPREEVVLGAEQHDIGWALFDLEPGWNPDTGLPRNFLEIGVEEHLRIWRGAPERLLSQSVHAALVVSLHGCAISQLRAHGRPDQASALQEHIDEERARQSLLLAQLGLTESRARRTQRQMWTWDGLSLALCNGWSPFTARDVPCREGLTDVALTRREDGTWHLDPWPFTADRVEARCEARRLAARYENDAAMRHAFANAQPVGIEFVLASR